MEINPEWVQGGSFAILVFFGWFIVRWLTKKVDDSTTRQDEIVAQFNSLSTEFLVGTQKHTQALKDIVEEMKDTRTKSEKERDELLKGHQQMMDDHREIMHKLNQHT